MNLFLLVAPYQVLSALELVHQRRMSGNHLVIMERGFFDRARFDAVVDPSLWDSVDFLDEKPMEGGRGVATDRPLSAGERMIEVAKVLHAHRVRRRLDRFAGRWSGIETLVLGHYGLRQPSHLRHLAHRIAADSVVVLDVGTDTLRIARFRRDEIEAVRSGLPSWPAPAPARGWKPRVREWLTRLESRPVPQLEFFSAYDLDLPACDRLVSNEFGRVRGVVEQGARVDAVYFVGQPLVDQQYVTPEVFSRALGFVTRYFDGLPLVYYRHPRESDAQLRLVRDQGIEIRSNAAPFEFEVSYRGDAPRHVATFFSSAVDSCSRIFGDTMAITAFRLGRRNLLKQHEEVEVVYQQYRSRRDSSVEVVDVAL